MLGYLDFVGGLILVGGVFLYYLVKVIRGMKIFNYFNIILKLLREVGVWGFINRNI